MLEKLQFMTMIVLGDLKSKREEKGATATEYGLLVGLIALVIIFGVTLFGDNLDAFFSDLAATVGTW